MLDEPSVSKFLPVVSPKASGMTHEVAMTWATLKVRSLETGRAAHLQSHWWLGSGTAKTQTSMHRSSDANPKEAECHKPWYAWTGTCCGVSLTMCSVPAWHQHQHQQLCHRHCHRCRAWQPCLLVSTPSMPRTLWLHGSSPGPPWPCKLPPTTHPHPWMCPQLSVLLRHAACATPGQRPALAVCCCCRTVGHLQAAAVAAACACYQPRSGVCLCMLLQECTNCHEPAASVSCAACTMAPVTQAHPCLLAAAGSSVGAVADIMNVVHNHPSPGLITLELDVVNNPNTVSEFEPHGKQTLDAAQSHYHFLTAPGVKVDAAQFVNSLQDSNFQVAGGWVGTCLELPLLAVCGRVCSAGQSYELGLLQPCAAACHTGACQAVLSTALLGSGAVVANHTARCRHHKQHQLPLVYTLPHHVGDWQSPCACMPTCCAGLHMFVKGLSQWPGPAPPPGVSCVAVSSFTVQQVDDNAFKVDVQLAGSDTRVNSTRAQAYCYPDWSSVEATLIMELVGPAGWGIGRGNNASKDLDWDRTSGDLTRNGTGARECWTSTRAEPLVATVDSDGTVSATFGADPLQFPVEVRLLYIEVAAAQKDQRVVEGTGFLGDVALVYDCFLYDCCGAPCDGCMEPYTCVEVTSFTATPSSASVGGLVDIDV